MDKDLAYVKLMLEDISTIADKVTLGNVSHNIAAIKCDARKALECLDSLQEEPVKIKKGCKYRCLSDMANKDTGKLSFIRGKIYLAPEDDTLASEENGWLCDTSENASNFELVEEHVSVWHDSGEMPKEKKVCLIRYSANDGASTNNFEVVIAEPLTRRFVTRSYPHKTGYQHTIHGENTIKVDEYQDRREYIPFSDIDEWAYIDDLLNLSNVQRIVKNRKEPISKELDEAAVDYAATGEVLPNGKVMVNFQVEKAFRAGAKWGINREKAEIQAQSMALAHGCPKEHISEELEEAAKNVGQKYFPNEDNIWARPNYEAVKAECAFKDGANWQKEKTLKESEDAIQYVKENHSPSEVSDFQNAMNIAVMKAFDAGKEKMREQMMAKAFDAEVKVDAGGYPYIPAIELYDYDNDVPLAKEGDKYKVVLIKED